MNELYELIAHFHDAEFINRTERQQLLNLSARRNSKTVIKFN